MFENYLDRIKSLVKNEIVSFLDIYRGYLAITDGCFMAIERLPTVSDAQITVENVVINPEKLEKFNKTLQAWRDDPVLAEGTFNPSLVTAAMLPHEGKPIRFRLVKGKNAPAPVLLLLSEDAFSAVMGMNERTVVNLYEPYYIGDVPKPDVARQQADDSNGEFGYGEDVAGE